MISTNCLPVAQQIEVPPPLPMTHKTATPAMPAWMSTHTHFADSVSSRLPRSSSLTTDTDPSRLPRPARLPPDLRLLLLVVCLYVLSMNCLQMDPHASESSLQKTSPAQDPAAIMQLSSELTAQANQLALHQHQLARLTMLTEELVKTLQNLTPPPPAVAASTMPVSPPTSQPASVSSRLAFHDKFDGNPTKCKGFLLQCSIFVNQQPALYPTDTSRISFVCSLLTDKALDWATAVWGTDGSIFPTFNYFLQSFREVFDHPTGGKSAGEQLPVLTQGEGTAAEFALAFRTLAAQTTWVEDTLKLLFRRGLNADLQAELACWDEGRSLKEFIELTIRIDNLIRSRRPTPYNNSSSPTASFSALHSEPMQIGFTRLSPEERERRMRLCLCLYCGKPGHLRSTCPTRPGSPGNQAVSSDFPHLHSASCVVMSVKLSVNNRTIEVDALIDSGAAGNFMSYDFAQRNYLPLTPNTSHLAVEALDGRPLEEERVSALTEDIIMQVGNHHSETLRFYVIFSPNHQLILGLPWLRKHDPHISWSRGEIQHWGPHCPNHCIPAEPTVPENVATSTEPLVSVPGLPAEYHNLALAFSKHKASQLPPHRPSDIDLIPGSTPPKGRIFPLSQPESEAMKKYIEEELAKGFIRPSTSPATTGFFFVKKKDGTLRPCIDYRGLNDITIKFRYPLPLVPAALEQLRRAKYFTKLDLRAAYNLIRIREGDEWKTAFSTSTGHYEYCVMPFELANSPLVFQSFINDVFRDMLDRCVIVYINDILIFSDSFQDHVLHVRAVLQRLVQYQLYAKAEKCEFHQTSFSFLGYIISQEGVAMDEAKVRAVTQWPQPQTLKELQRFLGFANFYRRFIRGYSIIAAPLTSMTKRGSQFLKGTPAALQAFADLKSRFTTAPILHHPDPSLPFIVEVDASSTAECNYDVGNRELLAMKAALEEWRHWLKGALHPFTILTDHNNLEYLRSAKRLNPRQASDRPNLEETILPETLLIAPVQWDIMTEINLTNEQHPPPLECPPQLTFVPETHRKQLLHHIHSTPSSGHPGITATLHLLNNRFWWPTINQDTQTFVKNCQACSTCKPSRQLPAGLLQPLPIPQRPWSHIAIDFVTDLPSSRGNTTILTIVDRFSKSCRLIPLPKLPTAMETAETLCNFVFRFYGLPDDIVSDCGPQFTSRLWSSFFGLLNVNVSLTSGYHPQTNGQTERVNQELTRFLRTYCHNHQTDWSRYLMWAEYAQNSLVKPATGLTPFRCVLGYQPPLFPWSGEPSDLPSVNEWLQRSEETWNRAHQHLQQAVRRQEEQANRHRRPNPEYQDSGFGYPLGTCDSGYPARSSVPGMARKCTRSGTYSTPDAGAGYSSTWSIGRGKARKNGLGSMPVTCWTPRSRKRFMRPTRRNRPLAHVEDPGVDSFLASGAARRVGALLQASLPQHLSHTTGGSLHPNINH
ncbi:Retrotransposon-like protein 1 [Labeo rohita]|uniref:Gypsy retrotransposon integrase-like protein 1 n=1 Tax=Labeo rohita TaxID=84645 RepID=A0ABQ8L4P6_LABRO|nr:Retrotransposon-like protein 1 [Labeo rohita]